MRFILSHLSATNGATLRQMHLHLIGFLYLTKRLALVPRLPSQCAFLPFGQGRLYPLLPIPITAGWSVAILTVHSQPAAQLRIFCLQMDNLGLQTRNFRFQRSQPFEQNAYLQRLFGHRDSLAKLL